MLRSRKIHTTVIIIFSTIVLMPVLLMFSHSVLIDNKLSFSHYFELISDFRQGILLIKSIGLALTAMILALIWGITYAFILGRTHVFGKPLFKWAFLLPLGIPPHIHSIAWLYFLKGNLYFQQLMDKHPVCPLLMSALVLSLAYFPFVTLLTLSGLNNMDRSMEESALLNHTPFVVITRITLPLVSPYIWSAAIFVFVLTLFDYGVPSLFQVQTYPVDIFAQFSAFYNEGRAMAMALPLILSAMALFWIQKHIMGNRSYITVSSTQKPTVPISSGIIRYAGFMILFMILSISVILPVLSLVISTHTFQSIKIALTTSKAELAGTFLLSLISAGIMVLIGFFMAQWIVASKQGSSRSKISGWIDYLSFIPFAIPATALGIGLIYFWNRPVLQMVYQSCAIMVIAYIARFCAFTIQAMVAELSKMSHSLFEAADQFEKSFLRRLIKIDLPLCRVSLVAAFIIAFVLCMNELGASLLVIPPGQGTVSLKIYNLLHYGADSLVAALSLCLIMINLLVAGGIVFLAAQTFKPRAS